MGWVVAGPTGDARGGGSVVLSFRFLPPPSKQYMYIYMCIYTYMHMCQANQVEVILARLSEMFDAEAEVEPRVRGPLQFFQRREPRRRRRTRRSKLSGYSGWCQGHVGGGKKRRSRFHFYSILAPAGGGLNALSTLRVRWHGGRQPAHSRTVADLLHAVRRRVRRSPAEDMQDLHLEGSGDRLHDANLLEDVLYDGAREGRILWWIGWQARPVVGCGTAAGRRQGWWA